MNTPTEPNRQQLPILEEVGADLHRLFRAAEARTSSAGTISRWIRKRPRTVVPLLAALAVAAASAAAAVSLSDGRTTPVALPGGGALCPLGYEYAAYASLGVVYPPNYPGVLPRHAAVTGCYISEQGARSAGYKTAPTPPDDERIGSLYVAPAATVVLHACQAAQHTMPVAVYCPGRLPAPWYANNGYDCPTTACPLPLLNISGGFTGPDSYVGSAPTVGNISVWAASTTQQRLYPYLVGCDSTQPLRATGRAVFRGYPATWYQCPVGVDNNSAVLQWRIGHELYGISASGATNLSRRLIEYIAAHLTRLAPKR